MDQIVKRNNEIIAIAKVILVTINNQGKPIKIPKILEDSIK